jgi:hypothetical protein
MPPRNKIPSGKVQINPLISVELYNMLREVALSQHENYRGAISAIVEEALRLYFSQRLSPWGGGGESTRTHGTRGRLQANGDKVLAEFTRILEFIRRERNYPENEVICEILASELVRAIQATIGVDKRTVNGRLKLFQEHKLIVQEKRDHQVIFRVLIYPECREA